MRALAIGLALTLLGPAHAQRPAPKKKPATKQVAHKKPTPQQIRRFDELEKKQDGKTR